MKLLFKHIKELIQVRDTPISFVSGTKMQELPTIKDAFLLVEDGRIVDFGVMKDCPKGEVDKIVDASGRMILPTWCDSHTHIVYAGNREGEFIDRIHGLTYEEIAKKGGGIVNSAKRLQETSEEELYQQSKTRLEEVIALGTGAIEIKSGYGLTPEAELKMLRVIKSLRQSYSLPIKATFLAAHALPPSYKSRKSDFIQMMIDEVLPIVAKEKLAEYIDVFCETGYFSAEDTVKILSAADKYGLVAKIHVNQFNAIGGVEVGVQFGARSVDHLEVMRKEDINILKGSQTMPVALPGCSYFLRIPYTPARDIIDAGLPIALASDYNPGSAPSGNMNFVISSACIHMRMTPEEAINAGTINGAYAMGLEQEVGSISIGKRANLIMTKPINSYGVLPYSFGSNLIDTVYLDGKSWSDERNSLISSSPSASSIYSPPENTYWQGRKTKPSKGAQYWYQAIQMAERTEDKTFSPDIDIAILGYACDEGVRRNQGRVGAVDGPDNIRKQLAKLAFHHERKKIADVGTISCPDGELEATQQALSDTISQLISQGIFPIVLGGGHDIAYGHFKGILSSLKQKPKKIGIINFDAHFDLRPIETQANSGTPFYQILTQHKESTNYMAIGIQRPSNTSELFDIARQYQVDHILLQDCRMDNMANILSQLTSFIERNDCVYITIDIDGISSAYAPGVSASSPVGMQPEFIFQLLTHIFESNKVISCDLAELNPKFDVDNKTANLAAKLVDLIVGLH